ncbi:MBL fold metallo-hydrolase [Ornithinimicrobium sp. INDO-MA30-4]|uniref:MBL fold metallo-hydrolase n=1 Tax=Ornithinimicrobium sp. INDO-MA30-4 TaxID=2908651 RepID=UPI002882E6BC|nr:MBL fold metallo-hydrolase [Ornithinimicrobium sp. INDO-MA30-4]
MAAGPGEEALIVDPGFGVADQVREVLAAEGLRPAAILLTHGHYDHIASVTPLCSPGMAVHIHPDDRYRLADPKTSLGPGMVEMLERQFGVDHVWQEPTDVVDLASAGQLEIAGLTIGLLAAPGHTEGSVMFSVQGCRSAYLTSLIRRCFLATSCLPGRLVAQTFPAVMVPLCSDLCVMSCCHYLILRWSCPDTGRPPRSGASEALTPTSRS